jgi:hypothetical protein
VNYLIQALLQKPSECRSPIINLSGEALVINLSGEALVINLSGEALVINLSGEALVINLSGEALLSISVEKPLLSNLSENSISLLNLSYQVECYYFIHTNFLYIFRDCTCGDNNKRVLT